MKRGDTGARLAALDPSIRCYLFYGTDEAGSRALAATLQRGLGNDVERVDLSPAQLKGEPALLVDEACARSLFGAARCVRVDGAGDESVAAAELLLASEADGDPVILVAGSLRKDARLVKLLDGDAKARVQASYTPDAGDLSEIAVALGKAQGLRLNPDLATRLVAQVSGDRAVLASEIAKLAAYADTDVDKPTVATEAMLDEIGADGADTDIAAIVDAIFTGDIASLDVALGRSGAPDAVPVVRAVQRRLNAMAAARAEMERGATARVAVDRAGRALFWRERESIARCLPRWTASRLASALDRCFTLECTLKSSRGPGAVAADHFYLALARSARR